LIEAKGLSKRFGAVSLFENLDLLVTPKTRLGLLGDNGSGKSTLIKILLGMENADNGTVRRADGVVASYFEQSRETLQPELSVLKNICPEGDYVFFQGKSLHVRSYLDRFYFSGHKVDLPVRKLSGGEQARLRLAQLMLKQSQILILDEPTNDLDIEMLDSLETSLKEFDGAVILVTHDRYFLDAVSNQILAFPGVQDSDRDLIKFADYFQWERSRAKEKFELENMESTILKLEKELSALQREGEDPNVLADHKRLSEIHTKIASLQTDIEQRYSRWTELDSRK
jgi:ABC transport system ATP-binding/permease protein